MQYVLMFIAGIITGGAVVLAVNRIRRRDIAQTFSAISMDALRKNSEEFLKLADAALSKQTQVGTGELEGRKKQIDLTVENIRAELTKIEKSVADFETKRAQSFGEINKGLQTAAEQTKKLQDTTEKLQQALTNTRERGQWGERMADDILRMVGLVENINYTKQQTQEIVGTRPDFTFKLPQDMKINMDVKFPWDNYRNYLNSQSEQDKATYIQKFLSDTRKKVKEVKSRDYINPEDKTVDYAILFIPNEQVFCFLQENDSSILDDALRDRVILCSPVSLFAILCVIKQAVENFALEQTSDKILSLFGQFNKQWTEYKKSMDRVGDRIKQADDEFGKLVSTRARALERPLNQIDDLRKQRGIQPALLEEGLPSENPEDVEVDQQGG